MKLLNYIFTLITLALLATSCSQDELPGDGEDAPVTGQTQTYTFTVSPDLTLEGDAKTRSEGTDAEMPTRCFMQVIKPSGEAEEIITGTKDNTTSNYTFTVRLASNTEYTYLFWADNGTQEISSLTAVPYTQGTVAFAAKETGTPGDITNVSLKHAVAKVTLQTKEAISMEEGETIKVTTTCATTYNVANPSASPYSEQTTTKTFDTSADFTANSNIATFYFIPTSETQDVDVEFHLLKQTIEDVPLAANSHVTLQGDLSEDNANWGATKEYVEEQTKRFFTNDDGSSKGTYNLDTGHYDFNIQRDKIDDLAKVLSEILHKSIQIDWEKLDRGDIFVDEKFDDGYSFWCQYNIGVFHFISIYINSSVPTHYIYIDRTNSTLEDFSVVSDELEQSTE